MKGFTCAKWPWSVWHPKMDVGTAVLWPCFIQYHGKLCYIYIYMHQALPPPPPPPYGMGPIYWSHMRSSPSPPVVWWGCGTVPLPPLWCGGGVVWYGGYVWCVWSVWYGMFGKYGMFGMYGRYGMYGMSGWYCMDGRYGM